MAQETRQTALAMAISTFLFSASVFAQAAPAATGPGPASSRSTAPSSAPAYPRALDAVSRPISNAVRAVLGSSNRFDKGTPAAFSRDGKMILSVGSDNVSPSAWLWDVPDGKLIRSFSFPASSSATAFSADGRRIFTALNIEEELTTQTKDGRAVKVRQRKQVLGVCDVASGEYTKHDFGGSIKSMELSHDGKFLAAAVGGEVLLVDSETFNVLDRLDVKAKALQALAIAPDDKRVVVMVPQEFNSEEPARVEAWGLKTKECTASLKLAPHVQSGSLCISSDGKKVLIVPFSPAVLWEIGKEKADWSFPSRNVFRGGAITAGDSKALVVGWPTVVLDAASGKVLRSLDADAHIAASIDRKAFAIGSMGFSLVDVDLKPLGQPCFRHGALTGVCFTPQGQIITIGTANSFVWDGRTFANVRKFPCTGGGFGPLQIRNGTRWLVGDSRGDYHVYYCTAAGRRPPSIARPSVHLMGMGFIDDQHFFTAFKPQAYSNEGSVIEVWSTATGKKSFDWKATEEQASDLVQSEDGRLILLFRGTQCYQWALGVPHTCNNPDCPHPANIGRIRVPVDKRSGTSFFYATVSRDHRLLAYGSVYDLKVCELATGSLLLSIPGCRPGRLAFDPRGRFLAVQKANSGEVRLYDVLDGRMVAELLMPSSAHVIAFDPGGKLLITSGYSDSGVVWDTQALLPVCGVPAGVPDAAELARLRAMVESPEASLAGDAIKKLVEMGDSAVVALEKTPGPDEIAAIPADPETVGLVKQLDDDRFTLRREASDKLLAKASRSMPVVAYLRQVLAAKPSAEVAVRIQLILDEVAPAPVDGNSRFQELFRPPLRRVWALELIGTEKAKAVLRKLATAHDDEALAAEAAVRRLAPASQPGD